MQIVNIELAALLQYNNCSNAFRDTLSHLADFELVRDKDWKKYV